MTKSLLIAILALLVLSHKGEAAITATGSYCTAQSSANVNTLACTWTGTPVIGNNIHCWVASLSLITSFSVSDNGGTPNTYTQNGTTQIVLTTRDYGIFDSFNIMSVPTTTTLTLVGVTSDPLIGCMETKMENKVSSVDGSIATGSVTTGTTATATIVPNLNTDIAFCGGNVPATDSPKAGAGFTLAAPAFGRTGFSNLGIEYSVLTSAGSQSSAILSVGGTTGIYSIICGTYKSPTCTLSILGAGVC